MSYNINPCKACMQKYKNENYNINELNDCVVDTATAFSAFPSNNSLRGDLLGQNWQDCIAQKLSQLPYVAGKPRNFCNFQVNMAPRLLQVPHHYPALLEKTKNQKKALKMCHQMCEKERLTETCKATCDCDHNAVENFSKKVKFADECGTKGLNSAGIPGCKSSLRNSTPHKKDSKASELRSPKDEKSPTFDDEASAHPLAFWVPFIIVAILLSLVLLGFGVALFSRKIGQ